MNIMERRKRIIFYQGEGIYEDNGTKIPAKPGDVFFCKDGDGHGIRNDGEADCCICSINSEKIRELLPGRYNSDKTRRACFIAV